MQISDSSSRILAGLLEARTGQQLTMSRRWRIETALSALLRDRGIGIPEDEVDQVTRRFFRGRRTTAGSATSEIAGPDGAGTGANQRWLVL